MTQKKETLPKTKPGPPSKTTDPQEHMKGPVSSVMQNIREEAEENDQDRSKEEGSMEEQAKQQHEEKKKEEK